MFNLDPKKMQAVMKQMGISQEDIPVSRVVIEKPDGTRIIIKNPSVSKIKAQGQESFQISGDILEEAETEAFSQNDIKTIMDKTGCSREKAVKALNKTRDLAEAILLLKK